MKSARLKLAYAGTPELARSLLEFLTKDNRHDMELVITQPDRRSGRGRKTVNNPVKECAQRFNIPVLQPDKAAGIDAGILRQCDLFIVVGYGALLPRPILTAPRHGCINVHLSLLPRWRGASPIQHAILAGDKQSGVSIMRLDEGMDTGPVYLKVYCDIDNRETAGSLHDKLVATAKTALGKFLTGFVDGGVTAQAQNHLLASYAPKISKLQAAIDWRESNQQIDRKIRAFNPAPVAHTVIDGINLRIWQAEPIDEHGSTDPGKITGCDQNGLTVGTGEGLINIIKLQPAGGNIMSAADFLNGRPGLSKKCMGFNTPPMSAPIHAATNSDHDVK